MGYSVAVLPPSGHSSCIKFSSGAPQHAESSVLPHTLWSRHTHREGLVSSQPHNSLWKYDNTLVIWIVPGIQRLTIPSTESDVGGPKPCPASFSSCEALAVPWPQGPTTASSSSTPHPMLRLSNRVVVMRWGNGPHLLLGLFFIISAIPTWVIFLSVPFSVTSIQVWCFFAARAMSSEPLVQRSGSSRVHWSLTHSSYDWLYFPSFTVSPLPLVCSEHGKKHHSNLDTIGFVCSQLWSTFTNAAHSLALLELMF